MADFHSGFRSAGFGTYGDRKLEVDHRRTVTTTRTYYGPPLPASSYDYDHRPQPQQQPQPRPRSRQTKAPPSSAWGYNDPEMKRRKRVAKYKMYAVEGKVKASFRKGFRWLKRRCSELVHSCFRMTPCDQMVKIRGTST